MSLTYRSDLNRPLTVTEIDNNFRHFTGSHAITGSLTVSGGVTGELIGTASQAVTASYITLAQTASYVTLAQTASYVTLAQTASYVENARTASFVSVAQTALQANTASYVALAQTASYVLDAVSASFTVSSSFANNAATAATASYVALAQTASYIQNAQTASFVSLIQGPGIDINGLEISASVVTVNGQYPTNGNITVALTTTLTGTSASLALSSSGDVTASIAQGTLWIVSNDPTPSNNGVSYIYSSQSAQWYQVPLSDTATNDARYLKLAADNDPMQGTLDMGGYSIINAANLSGTASVAISASLAQTASYVALAQTASYVALAQTASYITLAQTASYITLAQTASYIQNAQTASFVLNAVSSSFAATASFITASDVNGTVENARVAVTASFSAGVFTLQQQDPLPGVVNGGLVVSSSGHIYYGLNGTWKIVDFD